MFSRFVVEVEDDSHPTYVRSLRKAFSQMLTSLFHLNASRFSYAFCGDFPAVRAKFKGGREVDSDQNNVEPIPSISQQFFQPAKPIHLSYQAIQATTHTTTMDIDIPDNAFSTGSNSAEPMFTPGGKRKRCFDQDAQATGQMLDEGSAAKVSSNTYYYYQPA